MYTTRSEQSRQKKQEELLRRKRRFRRWMLLNSILVAAIILVGVMYWTHELSPSSTRSAANRPVDSSAVAAETQVTESPSQSENPGASSAELTPQTEEEQDGTAEQETTIDEEEASHNEQAEPEATPVPAEPAEAEATDSGATDKPTSSDNAPDKDKQPAATPLAPQTDTQPQGKTVTLNFGGDVMFSGKMGELLAKKGYDYPYQYVKQLFTNDDLTVVNLETPVTSSNTTAADKTYAFKSSPEALPHMAAAGIDAVNLANNHILDQGVVGLTDTIRQLDASGVKYVGAGADAARAYEPVIFERKGIRIALLGFSRVIPKASWNAAANQPGVATAYDATAAEAAIRKAKSSADLVVVVAHWGVERSDTTVDHQTDLAHRFIDAGADLVVGGHPHVLQGVEQYKGKWIAYSTGNFIFTRSLTEKTWDTGVFQAVCSVKGDCSMKVIPYTANLGQPVPMEQQPAQTLLQRLQSLSTGVRFDVKGNAIPLK
ncbi:CapA family protein [Paenibacillus wenxiniae]|uniref:CapA family protein n=1 Tax=Paenibacillus wenxiniae TaxID=1636843 RepID=A0ABW4RJK0_9BACL